MGRTSLDSVVPKSEDREAENVVMPEDKCRLRRTTIRRSLVKEVMTKIGLLLPNDEEDHREETASEDNR